MDKKLKLKLVKEAQERLVNSPRDFAHEITHSYLVWQLAKRIVKHEGLMLNYDLLVA
jgi:HD superfamily phosphodiesterase